jgi:hypothetical protein
MKSKVNPHSETAKGAPFFSSINAAAVAAAMLLLLPINFLACLKLKVKAKTAKIMLPDFKKQ